MATQEFLHGLLVNNLVISFMRSNIEMVPLQVEVKNQIINVRLCLLLIDYRFNSIFHVVYIVIVVM